MIYRFSMLKFKNFFGKLEIIDSETNEVITTAEAKDVIFNEDSFTGVTNLRYIANQLGITIAEAKKLYDKQ